jgi:integrase
MILPDASGGELNPKRDVVWKVKIAFVYIPLHLVMCPVTSVGFKKIRFIFTQTVFIHLVGIKVTRFHDGRHTHASHLMAASWNPKYVQQRLGHSNISTTMDVYSHVTPEMMRKAMKRYEDYMKH